MKERRGCGRRRSGILRDEVGESTREEMRRGGVGVVVERRQMSGGHLGVLVRDVSGESLLIVSGSRFSRHRRPSPAATFLGASII